MLDTTVSHYRILDQRGGDGMGVVYRAEDLTLGRQVALGPRKLRRAVGFAGWFGLAPDGSLLLPRDVGTQEIYALELEPL